MSPEQVRDARAALHPADVYSLGTTWYAALTGVLPFNGSSPLKAMKQALNGEAIRASVHVPDLPRAVDELINWLLQGDPRARPRCGPSLVAEIEAVLRAPHDVQRVLHARQAHDLQRKRENMLTSCVHIATGAVGAVLFAWLVWETMMLRPQTEAHTESVDWS